MKTIQSALYARVSSDQQTNTQTIASQLSTLRERMRMDDCLPPAEREFIDEGWSGATLMRPALERLRDAAALGGIDRLYVHSPDRLARRYAYYGKPVSRSSAKGQLTRRSGGRSIGEVIERLRSYVLGWKAYFQLAQTSRRWLQLDEWMRRRMCVLHLKQWRRGKTIYRELLNLGAKPRIAQSVKSLIRTRSTYDTTDYQAT